MLQPLVAALSTMLQPLVASARSTMLQSFFRGVKMATTDVWRTSTSDAELFFLPHKEALHGGENG